MAGPHPCPVEEKLEGGWLKILQVPDELKGFAVTILDDDRLPEQLVGPLKEEFWRRIKALPDYFTTLEMGRELQLFPDWEIVADYDNGDQD